MENKFTVDRAHGTADSTLLYFCKDNSVNPILAEGIKEITLEIVIVIFLAISTYTLNEVKNKIKLLFRLMNKANPNLNKGK